MDISNICYWLEHDNGYWQAGCLWRGNLRLMCFPNGVGPVVACKGICPNCGKQIFEKVKRDPPVDDFLMELNARDFHR